jgi:hypothetical protein
MVLCVCVCVCVCVLECARSVLLMTLSTDKIIFYDGGSGKMKYVHGHLLGRC